MEETFEPVVIHALSDNSHGRMDANRRVNTRNGYRIIEKLNAGPSSSIYKTASRNFIDAQNAVNRGHSPKATFHSHSTHWRIDHIFVSPHFTPLTIEVPCTPETQMASDHLPFAAELELPVQQAHPKGLSKEDASHILQN
jgi:exonuclease III